MAVGTEVRWKDSPPPRTAPTDTGVWFVTGLTEKGPTTATRITNLNEFVTTFGDRQTWSLLYDAVDTFFREGGSVVYVSRVLGPAPVTARVDLSDGTNPTLRISASSAGEWGNALNVQVVAGSGAGTFVLVISHDTKGELYRSPDLADKAAAISWAAGTADVRASELAGTGDPAVVAAQSLATGTDDRTNAAEANWTAALTAFTKDLGPGQVSAPGRTTTAAHSALLAHAATRTRIALLDAPDASAVATLTTAAAAVRTDTNARFGAMFAPWATVPGVLPGTTRTVPYSAVQAGMIARSDATNTPNVPAAGVNGQALFASGVKYEFTADADRNTLNEAGVNLARVIYGGVRTYGWRTLVDPTTAPTWLMLGNARLGMHLAAQGDAILENYVLSEVDGRGHKLSQLYGELVGMMLPLWQRGSLFGETAEEAFVVDVTTVNTPESLQDGTLRAIIGFRPSPHAELVILELVKVSITEELA